MGISILRTVALLARRAQAGFTREYTIRPEKSKLQITVYKEGVLKAFGHNHSISANNISGRVVFDQTVLAASSADLRKVPY